MKKSLLLLLCGSLTLGGLYACDDDDTAGGDDDDSDAAVSSSSSSGATTSSSSSGGTSSSSSSGGTSSSSSGNASSSSGNASSSSGGETDGGQTVRLTIDNYLAWCSVQVDDGAASGEKTITVDVAPGTVVDLHADKISDTFVWGYWYGTDGDDDGEHVTDMSTTVTVNGDMIVQACCPFANHPDTPCDPPVAP